MQLGNMPARAGGEAIWCEGRNPLEMSTVNLGGQPCRDMAKPIKETERICKNCDIRFYIKTWRLKDKTRGQFCSSKCGHKYKIGQNASNWKGGKITRKCLICGKVMSFFPAQKRSYCSKNCWYKELSRICGSKHRSWKGGLPSCKDCEKKLSNYENLYCLKCAHKGERSYRWTGGKYSQSYRDRRRFRYEMQKLVFERDNYTCQLCSQGGGKLQIDHIQSWADYVELRFSLDNCRTLCQKCHYKITFGRPMPKRVKTWGHNLREVFLN